VQIAYYLPSLFSSLKFNSSFSQSLLVKVELLLLAMDDATVQVIPHLFVLILLWILKPTLWLLRRS